MKSGNGPGTAQFTLNYLNACSPHIRKQSASILCSRKRRAIATVCLSDPAQGDSVCRGAEARKDRGHADRLHGSRAARLTAALPLPLFAEASRAIGHNHIELDDDGVARVACFYAKGHKANGGRTLHLSYYA